MKFKVWDKWINEWLDTSINPDGTVNYMNWNGEKLKEKEGRFAILQFTNRYRKGEKIYELDIIEQNGKKLLVTNTINGFKCKTNKDVIKTFDILNTCLKVGNFYGTE